MSREIQWNIKYRGNGHYHITPAFKPKSFLRGGSDEKAATISRSSGKASEWIIEEIQLDFIDKLVDDNIEFGLQEMIQLLILTGIMFTPKLMHSYTNIF